ncbi:PIG-L deacetylase family protein [Nocardia sp. NPDC004722]
MAEPVIETCAAGTPDEVWRPWRDRAAPLPIPRWQRLIVVAAHPDDEVLGAGGLIALARRAEVPVTIVIASDGEASHPESPSHTPSRLATLRVDESHRAAAELGAAPPIRLGLPDGRLDSCERQLVSALGALLGSPGEPGVRCAATWRHDGHPDHEAVGRAAAAACASSGIRMLEYPVWMWHWATPAHPLVRAAQPVSLRLPAAVHAAKCRALARFRSQVLPLSNDPADAAILPEHVLRRFTGATETFLR